MYEDINPLLLIFSLLLPAGQKQQRSIFLLIGYLSFFRIVV